MGRSIFFGRLNLLAGVCSGILLLAAVAYFIIAPAMICVFEVNDPALKGPGIPLFARRLFKTLTPKYQKWCEYRVQKALGAAVDREDISGTEWPVFGSFFYLLAVEQIQAAWEKDRSVFPLEPRVYAKDAVIAATELILDPSHGNWVREHWGDDYLTEENAFYRMLHIGALVSYTRLTGDRSRLEHLRRITKLLADDIDQSKFGLLDDYPNQCYPSDVLTAIAMIKRSGELTGDNYGAFVERSKRGFSGWLLDGLGLPPYGSLSSTGDIFEIARGCGNSYVNIFAPEIFPQENKRWYDIYTKHFWQTTSGGAGFREFPKGMADREWYYDVDSGPVLCGYGFAASAFGVAAARINGRFDQAWPMSAEALVSSCPLPGGTLLGPRVLSNASDAPYLGEACMLFIFTTQPYKGMAIVEGGTIPLYFYVLLGLYLAVALWLAVPVLRNLVRLAKGRASCSVRALDGIVWLLAVLVIVVNYLSGYQNVAVYILAFLLMLVFPRIKSVVKNNESSGSAADK